MKYKGITKAKDNGNSQANRETGRVWSPPSCWSRSVHVDKWRVYGKRQVVLYKDKTESLISIKI